MTPAKRKRIPAPTPDAFEVSDRVGRQALVRPYQRDAKAPLYRPLRIYTLDPSVSDRVGGIATVSVPFEKLEPGPIGSLFKIVSDGAPPPLRAEALDLDDPNLLLSSGLSPSPANGLFHLQMVYAVCSLTYAAFRKALGREIAWATAPTDDGPLRLVVRPFGFEGTNAGYSREAGDLSFGYFSAGEHAAGFTLKDGLIATALSHDIVAHETTHASRRPRTDREERFRRGRRVRRRQRVADAGSARARRRLLARQIPPVLGARAVTPRHRGDDAIRWPRIKRISTRAPTRRNSGRPNWLASSDAGTTPGATTIHRSIRK